MMNVTALLIFIAMVCIAIISSLATSLWKDRNKQFINFVSGILEGLPLLVLFLVGTIIYLLA